MLPMSLDKVLPMLVLTLGIVPYADYGTIKGSFPTRGFQLWRVGHDAHIVPKGK